MHNLKKVGDRDCEKGPLSHFNGDVLSLRKKILFFKNELKVAVIECRAKSENKLSRGRKSPESCDSSPAIIDPVTLSSFKVDRLPKGQTMISDGNKINMKLSFVKSS